MGEAPETWEVKQLQGPLGNVLTDSQVSVRFTVPPSRYRVIARRRTIENPNEKLLIRDPVHL